MQTFLPYSNPYRTAQVLDRQRLGKQRIEALQVASCLLEGKTGWSNHPAVRMWKGYESYLLKVYTPAIMAEWIGRGYNNEKSGKNWQRLVGLLDEDVPIVVPTWCDSYFCLCHQSNLVRKKPEHYRQYFPDVPDDLEYVWPV